MNSKKKILSIFLFIGLFFNAFSQQSIESGRVEAYRLEVTYHKTSHLIFPVSIRYVDLGSALLIGDQAADAPNVLRIKAAVKDFTEETNFSVITEDGRFYSFNVTYNADPFTLNYDIKKMKEGEQQGYSENAQLEELGFDPPSRTEHFLKTIYKQNKRRVKHIGSRSYGIYFILKGLYVDHGKYFFHLEIKNKSNVPFVVNFLTYKITDRKVAKRTVSQEIKLIPLRQYPEMNFIADHQEETNVVMMDQFTIADDQILRIEIFEKNGARNQILEIDNADLVAAKPVSEIKLKQN
jgi:conjugative transposon TraN protein